MSTRWVVGICLGCGLSLIVSGIAQTIFFQPPPLADDPNRPGVTRQLPGPASDAIDKLLKSPPLLPGDDASPEDYELANEFSRALKDRRGVSISRSAHNTVSKPR